MSHFAVIVVTKEYPTDEVLKKKLQPYHEFECTGIYDEYVKEIDETDEVKDRYDNDTVSRFKDSLGNLHDPYENRFYRDPTNEEKKEIGPISGTGVGNGLSWHSKDWGDGKGYQTKIHFTPNGYEDIKVPVKDVMSFKDYVVDYQECDVLGKGESKYRFCVLNDKDEVVRIVKRTNPNAKWDYWRIGGRYTGKFQSKTGNGTQADPTWEWKSDNKTPPQGKDICQKCDLDWDHMKAQSEQKRRDRINECIKNAKVTPETFEKGLQEKLIAHAQWMRLEGPKPRGGDYETWLSEKGFESLVKSRKNNWELPVLDSEKQTVEDWIKAAPAVTSFALLSDDWYEKGDMGWWGCVSDEKDNWDQVFEKEFAKIDDRHWLTVVDCHI